LEQGMQLSNKSLFLVTSKKKFLFASPLVLSHRITEPESTIIKIPKTPTSSTLQQIFHPFNKQGIELSIEVEELGLPGTS